MLVYGEFASSPSEVYFYTVSGGTWSSPQTIDAPGQTIQSLYGYSLALSRDGQTAVMGSPGANQVFVSTFSGASFPTATELDLAAGGSTFLDVGSGVAISSQGEVIIVGAPDYNAVSNSGAALFFMQLGTSYGAGQQLVPSTVGGGLGSGVAVSGDGLTAAAGQTYLAPGAVEVWLYQ